MDGTKAKPQINFAENLSKAEVATMFFIIEEAKETVLDFSRGTVKVLWFYFVLIKYSNDTGLNIISKNIKHGISSITRSGKTITNKEIKDIMKAIKSLKNRRILL